MTVGGSSCPITSLTESALQCTPPETPNAVDGSGYSAVKVGVSSFLYEPRYDKTGLQGFRPGPTQTGLYNHTRWLEA